MYGFNYRDKTSFGEWVVQELRKEKNATKEDLAAHLGITVRAYRYYEEGKRYPDFQGLIALADYFGVTLDDLVGRTAPGL